MIRPVLILSSTRHCEERSDEAIQKNKQQLDCFALLAMTEIEDTSNVILFIVGENSVRPCTCGTALHHQLMIDFGGIIK